MHRECVYCKRNRCIFSQWRRFAEPYKRHRLNNRYGSTFALTIPRPTALQSVHSATPLALGQRFVTAARPK
jgi:hypothetical protein